MLICSEILCLFPFNLDGVWSWQETGIVAFFLLRLFRLLFPLKIEQLFVAFSVGAKYRFA